MAGIQRKEIEQMLDKWKGDGARVEDRGNRVAVFAPDGSPPYSVHWTISDARAHLNMRSWGKRHGLSWYAEYNHNPNSRAQTEEEPMSAAELKAKLEPIEHVVIPAAVASAKYPPEQTQLDAALPVLIGMPATFWTDHFRDAAIAEGLTGYGSVSAGMRKAQQILDHMGFRVVEAKRNRNGYSYRWVRDPDAVIKPGSPSAAERSRLRAVEQPKPEPTPTPAAEPVQEETETMAVIETQGDFGPEELVAPADTKDVDWALGEIERLEHQLAGTTDALTAEREAYADLLALKTEAVETLLTLQQVAEAQEHDIADLKARLRSAEEATAVHPVDEGWWPLDPSNQTLAQVVEGAHNFGLEVRIQARRNAR